MSNIIKRTIKSSLRTLLIWTLQNDATRMLLNKRYNSLSYKSKSRFHTLFAKTFRDKRVEFKNSTWNVKFNNTMINLPLVKEELWLDWDEAISILGHDIKIKETYQDLIERKQVKCFLDIGANYGTHSLLFLSQGIETVTFEPNPHCVKGFRKLLVANGLAGNIVANAVGDRIHNTELHFPENQTWLGTLSDTVLVDLKEKFNLNKVKTNVITLDSYLTGTNLIPDLIKIDTEGYEFPVLSGAIDTIRKYKPMIIFEENEGAEVRNNINHFFDSVDYVIYTLPYTDTNKNPVTRGEFLSSKETNFIAFHKGE